MRIDLKIPTARATAGALALALLTLAPGTPAQAGFTGNDVIIPAVARAAGAGGAQFYSTLWVTNLSAGSITVEYRFLRQGQANPVPQTASATFAAGETKKYENVVETLFGLSSGAGAIRVVASGKVLVSSRTYDQPSGVGLDQVKGLFFGAVPATFAISQGDVGLLQGVTQGGSENYRYNFGMVETTGQAATVRITLRGEAGAVIGSTEYALAAGEARQVNVGELLGSSGTTNGRIEGTVVAGSGKVLLYGTQIANGSQDSAGFEMSFKDGLLAETSTTSSANVEAATSSVLTTTYLALRKTLELVPQLGAPPTFAERAASPQIGAYDPATGFWTYTGSLDSGQSGTIQIQFRDQAGNFQRLYNPLATVSIVSRGSVAGIQGQLTFDILATGTTLLTPTTTVSGTGTGNYQGTAATIAINSVVVPKVSPFYPTSGTVVVNAGGSTVTVTFNGSQFAHGSYTFHGVTVTFTVNLVTGEVTKP